MSKHKKLTIMVDAEIYDGLHSVIGRRRISRFLNDLARPWLQSGKTNIKCQIKSELLQFRSLTMLVLENQAE